MLRSKKDHDFVFELCLGSLAGKLPQLREAMSRQDGMAIKIHVRDLLSTASLLGLSTICELGHEIENGWVNHEPATWQKECHRFYDLFERIQFSLQQKLGEN